MAIHLNLNWSRDDKGVADATDLQQTAVAYENNLNVPNDGKPSKFTSDRPSWFDILMKPESSSWLLAQQSSFFVIASSVMI